MAYDCNLDKKSTRNISPNSIEIIANNYLTSRNLQKYNDRVIAIANRMMIHKLFKKDPNITHTSSDGQKFDVLLDSIHANYSFKYFGKEKSISIYSFISDSHQVFHGLAFSASDREAYGVARAVCSQWIDGYN
jgi:TnpA family transposase